MKKNISINISGIIFHIEEDGFDTLKKYLDSINKYFSSFEDSSEILADIESRIAEIFLSKLNEGKQVITTEDVSALVTTMGSVSDFQAAEEEEFAQPKESTSERKNNSSSEEKQYSSATHKTLLRDQKRKILGGVCSGIGNYLNIDPVWIRLLFAVLAFAYGLTLWIYIIMWIVVPGSFELDEAEVGRKMYRDTDRKVVGGVAGGLSSFFAIDIIAVRILFVIFSFFGGLGLVVYAVLWIVLPEARSLTDKMQMQGEPVTLSNIESNIKKNLNVKEDEEESTFVKILLLPFRLIGFLLTGLGKILGPLVEVIRVAIGVFIFLLGLSMTISVVMSAGILFGLLSGASVPILWGVDLHEIGFPLEAFQRSFPGWTILAGFFAAIIPGIFVILLGVSAIAKRIVFSATVGWSLFILFFVSMIMLAIGIPRIVYSFKEDGEVKVENTYDLEGKTAVLRINEVGMDDYDVTHLTLRGHDESTYKLEQRFEAQGSTRSIAMENAQMVDYNVLVKDSIFTFDSNIQFKNNAIFRAQRLDMILYIPYNKPFVIDDGLYRILNQYDYSLREKQTWIMTEFGLHCVSCPDSKDSMYFEEDVEDTFGESDAFGLVDFDAIDVSGAVDLRIEQGDKFAVELIGSSREKERYRVFKDGNKLIIDLEENHRFSWKNNVINNFDEMRINITMPSLHSLELKGSGKVSVKGFNEKETELKVIGAMKIRADINVENLSVEVSGASEVNLSGQGQRMNADIQGASKLNAYDFEVRTARVDANGVSHAKVYVTGTLEMEESFASEVDYRGDPKVIRNR